jgi:uncharacterized protein (TIRG00374 family)
VRGKGAFWRNLLSLVLVVGLILVAHKYLDIHLMVKAWRKFSWSSIGLLLAFPLTYLFVKGWRFILMLRAVQGEFAIAPILRGFIASQSATLLPGGFAARSALLAQADVPMERSLGPALGHSGLDQLVLLVCGLFLAFWYPSLRPAALGLSAALATVVAILSLEPSRKFVVAGLLKIAGKLKKREKMDGFLEACGYMADGKLLLKCMVLSLAANLCSYGILCTVVAALGMKVAWLPLGAAFVLPTLLGRVSPLPAGAGVTEAGMVTFMAHNAAMSVDEAAAATTLMRIFDVVVPAFYGGLVYFFGWKGEQESAEVEEEAGERQTSAARAPAVAP